MNSVLYAILDKIYRRTGQPATHERRYSPSVCVGAKGKEIIGNPNPAHISTSFAERQNLTMRMRRFRRLTNAFSKKFANHCHMIAIYKVQYNWVRVHKMLRVTPCVAAKVTDRVWDWIDIVAIVDAEAPKSSPRGPYEKRSAGQVLLLCWRGCA